MHTDESIENLLAGLPVARPDAAREKQLLAALQAAAMRKPAWWQVRIPLWQAAAACITVAAAGVLGGSRAFAPPPVPPTAQSNRQPPIRIMVESPVLARLAPAYETDVTRWTALPQQEGN